MTNVPNVHAPNISAALKEHDVIGDVVTDPYASQTTGLLGIRYNNQDLAPGATLPRVDTLSPPEISFTGAQDDESYVVIMVDPDLFKKHDTLSGQVRHWVQELTFTNGKGRLGAVITEYVPCTPQYGTGAHRYVFLLCRQGVDKVSTSDFVRAPEEDLKDRMSFYVQDYMTAKNMGLVAANFMYVSADAKSAVENVGMAGQTLLNMALGK